ncbi:hypothetical protein ACHAWF_015936 [Thalassiosira exigua]
MIMMKTPPPLPPPPPPPSVDDNLTFLERWIEKEKKVEPSIESKREYFNNECLFPRHIPAAGIANVDPMISLISHQAGKEHGMVGRSENSPGVESEEDLFLRKTALDDVRKIASLCATYDSRASINLEEFKYKRAVLRKEKASQTLENAPSTTHIQPPHHDEYSPLSIHENFLLARIHRANYNVCLAAATCPERTKRLAACWKRMDPQLIRLMEKEGVEGFVCLEEREAVERCVGLGVQRVMKAILS